MDKVIYIVSARSFSKTNHMRKIGDLIKIWNSTVCNFYYEFGGDFLILKKNNSNINFGNQKYYESNFRNNKFLNILSISFSEFKDILHDFYMKMKIFKKYKFNIKTKQGNDYDFR